MRERNDSEMVVLQEGDLPVFKPLHLVKRCSCCGVLRLIDEFWSSAHTADRLNSRCKRCCRRSQRRWYAKGGEVIERRKAASRERYHRKKLEAQA